MVIGTPGASIAEDRAMDHVAAYTVANDVTARTVQRADAKRGWPWIRAKSPDTFLPLGPGLVPAVDAPDPDDLPLAVRVNGETRQRGSTSRLLWPIARIVSSLSRYVALETGDLILTGTPEGVGPILPGDRVEVDVAGVGLLSNPVEGQR
jgi:2-keto-4-pentenoate hydratase/2-oxohepta-3-ene-1,7-dioic acid hydratase in catechol pathway